MYFTKVFRCTTIFFICSNDTNIVLKWKFRARYENLSKKLYENKILRIVFIEIYFVNLRVIKEYN